MAEILEEGTVTFLYRPRVDREDVEGLDDVQRFYMVLAPDGNDRFRLIILGRKRLPDPERHEREWGFVAEVGESPDELRDELEPKEYDTRTRGHRVAPGARPVGEGRYAIVDHDGHTHLAYVLTHPPRPAELQRTFNIGKEASYVIAVRNPDAPAPPGAGLAPDDRALFPPRLRERFAGRRFISTDIPEFLDHERAELVLIGAAEDASRELGIDLDAEDERASDAGVLAGMR